MMTFETTTEVKKYAKENHRNVCSCFYNYPNPFMGNRCKNYEPCDAYGFKRNLSKQYCLRKKGEEHDKG